MNIILPILIISWTYGSGIYRIFSGYQGYTQHDIYMQKKYKIKPDRSDDEEETIKFREENTEEL